MTTDRAQDEPMTTTTEAITTDRYANHYANGRAAGIAAGSWVVDGNTSTDDARRILAMLNDGDPEIYDRMPGSPLSGEWAGESMTELLGDDADDLDAADFYEDGFTDGWEYEVERAASYIVNGR